MDSSLTKGLKILLFLFLLVASLYYARPFLVPVVFASLLAMLLLPLCRKLQQAGINKAIAIVISILLFLALAAGIIWLLYWQVSDMVNHAASIEATVNQKITAVRHFISNRLGLSFQKQAALLDGQSGSMAGKITGMVSATFSSLTTFLANLLLVLIYIFLFLFYRSHLKRFILKLVPPATRQNTVDIIESSRKVAQEYITGLALMIGCLWVMYGIGFSIVGIKNPVFFAILCGLLEIVPFVGNLTGTSVTVIMTLAQGGTVGMAIGVVVTYSVVQFVQSYVIQPLVVGKQVNINPIFSIAGIVMGNLIWGIPGMVLVIPVLGIAKIVFDHIEPLKPYGFLIGETKTDEGPSFLEKVKKWFSK